METTTISSAGSGIKSREPSGTQSKSRLKLSPNAFNVLQKRYLRKVDGKIAEEPEDLFRRVANNISLAEKNYKKNISPAELGEIAEQFYEMMTTLEFLPNSPTLMNAGRELQQLSACFVLPVMDSMEGIFNSLKDAALIHKSGGGTGFSFSRLRPRSDQVMSTGGVASGPVSFMKVFNAATEAVKQGGTRRGANMGILRIDHPDIMDFITAKQDNKDLTNFNISVAATDKFMEAVNRDGEYDLINPRTKTVAGKLKAREVFDRIVESAWQNGEPGIIFLDRVNHANPTPRVGEIESTNPCGEQPLLPYESCNLGSVNLARMFREQNGNVAVDYDRLRRVVHLGVRFLDDVIEMNKYPLHTIEQMTKSNRKIGLGVMGFADLLIQMGIPYNSEEALKVGSDVMKFIKDEAMAASARLANERGTFPNFRGSIYDKPGLRMQRNATTTTIAPTGTLSIIADASSGIEPLFAVCYERNVLDNTRMIEVNKYFEAALKKTGIHSDDLMKKIAHANSIQGFTEIPAAIRKVFVTAHDIAPEWHVKMQSVFQKYTDNAVSKTVNFPNSASKEDVIKVFIMAYAEGCKGITVYRDGSRDQQVLSTGKTGKTDKPSEQVQTFGKIVPRSRPAMTEGVTTKVGTGCGNFYVTINKDEKGLFEVFAHMGKSGGCAASQSEAISRLISLALRSGVEIEAILKQLKGIRCPAPLWDKGDMVLSCPDAIAKAISRYIGQSATKSPIKSEISEGSRRTTRELAGTCPDCGGILEYVEDCVLCHACGYSKCG